MHTDIVNTEHSEHWTQWTMAWTRRQWQLTNLRAWRL